MYTFKLLSTTKVILDKPVWLPQETYIRMTNKWGNSGRSYVRIRCILWLTHETNSTALRLQVRMTTFIGSHITSMYAFLVNAQLLQIILIMIIRRWRTIKNESSCRWGAARSLARSSSATKTPATICWNRRRKKEASYNTYVYMIVHACIHV